MYWFWWRSLNFWCICDASPFALPRVLFAFRFLCAQISINYRLDFSSKMVNSLANTSSVSINSSDENLAQCREVFLYFDSKGDDKIAVSQIGDVLRAVGQNPTQAEINKFCEHWSNQSKRILSVYLIDFCFRYAHHLRGIHSNLLQLEQEPFKHQRRGVHRGLVSFWFGRQRNHQSKS